ncbi:MAG: TonB-dependent receptor [Bacteroidales bacterium]|nr:TonB-dependent receptor [Bacteroidales bacterium]
MKKNLLILLSVFITTVLFAQTSSVKGFVYDKETGEPVIFTNVYLKGTKYGTSTDINGYFYIDKIEAGTYNVEVSFLGYATFNKSVTIKDGESRKLNINLEKSVERLGDVVVSAKKQEAKTEVRMSVVKLSPKEITALPSMGSEPDLAQAIQVLPGVVFTGDQGGQLYIRGGSPIQNKVLLDGMTIYQPFHSIGFFSVFETDLISNADIYTGGFNAEYGGRVSSIMDINLRDGNKLKQSGKLSLSTFGANLMLEGPLKKQKEDSKSAITYVLYGKTSYLEESSKLLYSYANEDGLPFSYNDLYGKLTFSAEGGSKISLFGFRFTDQVLYKNVSNFNWNQWGLGTKIVVVPENVPTIITVRSSFSNYEIGLDNDDNYDRYSQINGFDFGLNFHYFMGRNDFDYGVEVMGNKTNFTFANSVGRVISQVENTTEIAGYLKPKFVSGRFVVEPGLRLHYYASLNNFSFEPRLGVKFNMLEWLRFKLAGGLYSQNLIAATSDRDVVNLFYGFLSGPDNLPKTFDGEELTTKLQKAKHIIVGSEIDITRDINLNVEAYWKIFDQLTNINRNKLYDDTSENSEEPDELKKDFIVESGDAYGIDFTLNYEKENFSVWLVYSHGYVNRFDGDITYRTHYDRRHNVNLMTSYKFGKTKTWVFGLRWNYGSGFPFTPVSNYYEQLVLNNNIDPNVESFNGQVETVYGDINSFQLSDYHRLDMSIKKSFEFKKSSLEAAFTVTNVYNRKNIFYVDTFDNERIYQLPILPSIGLSFKF